jgi:hypothetical protein
MGFFDLFKREPTARVLMLLSVDQFPAGESFDLPVEVADRFIIRGYASGELSREYSEEELVALHRNHQVVNIGG